MVATRTLLPAPAAGKSAWRRLDRLTALGPPVLLLGGSAVGGAARAAGASVPPAAGLGVLLAGLLVGLPHGALDVDRISAGRTVRQQAGLVAGYLAAVAAAFLAWLARPALTVAALLVLAVAHFGLTDLAELSRRCRSSVPAAVRPALAAAYGGIPVVFPFALAAGRTRPLLERLSAGSDAVIGLASRALPVVVAAAVVGGVWGLASRRACVVLDLAALTLAFAVLPPLIAFGLYFGGWHALRQTGQLVRERAGAGLPLAVSGAALARRAVAPTAGAVILIVVLALWHGMNLPAADLALLLAVTVPHSVVSAWKDRWNLLDRTVPGPNRAPVGSNLP
jgi:Brp/Blh family beta-carotene 15,15'-monooxygenase